MSNILEIGKLGRLAGFWLAVTFGAVWIACWLVGIFLPELITGKMPFVMRVDDPSSGAMFTADLLRALTPILSLLVFIPINAMFMVLFERRSLAIFTVRKGPNKTLFDGLGQTAADAVKLLFKEDITPRGADAFMFTLAPIIFFAPSIFGALPLLAAVTNNHDLFAIGNLPTGIFYILAAASIPVVALVMAGWASNNKYSLVGGLRSAAQAISYEIPLVLSLVTMCLLAGTLDVVQIVEQQKGGIFNWNLFGGGAAKGAGLWFQGVFTGVDTSSMIAQIYPHGWLSIIFAIVLFFSTILLAGLYLTGACAEINRIPFDLPEAESELVSGYNTEYSGIKFAIFFLAEFTNLFVVSSIATVMFLGGGDNPIPTWVLANIPGLDAFSQTLGSGLSLFIDQLHLINPSTFWAAFWIIIKVYSIVFFAILVRGTLPRFRIDQLMDFGWKRLIPLALLLFIIVVFARTAVVLHG